MKRIGLLLGILLIVGGSIFFLKREKSSQIVEADRLYTIVREDMTFGILSSGTLTAKKNHLISSGVDRGCKISWIIPENSIVKKGDLLVAFSEEDLLTELENSKVEYENSLKELDIANEEVSVLKSTNTASIKTAEDAVRTAADAYYKYIKLEGPKAKDEQFTQVENALKEYEEAQDAYEKAVTESKNTVYDTDEEEETAKKNIINLQKMVVQKEVNYNNSLLNRKIFKRYNYPNQITSLENALEQAKLNLQKTKITNESSLVQKDNSIISIRNRIQRNKKLYEKNLSNSKLMKIYSPVDGIVIYGNADSMRWGNDIDVKVGTEIYKGQVMMTIPEMSSMLIRFELPEAFRSKVEVGNKAIITADALGTVKLHGEISNIAPLPVNQIFWDKSSPKIYNTEIQIVNQNTNLVSGMSVQIEVVTQTIKEVIAVPIESVYEENGEFFVYLNVANKPVRKKIIIGPSNELKVQVVEGLSEGQKIFLFNPFLNEG